jgi:hypothetical protein
MLRSETKKGRPWWCSECGEYVEFGEEAEATATTGRLVSSDHGLDAAKQFCGIIARPRPDWFADKAYIDASHCLTIGGKPFGGFTDVYVDAKATPLIDEIKGMVFNPRKAPGTFAREWECEPPQESDEALRKRIRERLLSQTMPIQPSVIRAAVVSALRYEFGCEPNVAVVITDGVAHITVSGIDA